MHVWVVSWETESSDRGVYVFVDEPTEKELEEFFKEHHSEEYEDGVCYIYWDVEKQKLIDNRKF